MLNSLIVDLFVDSVAAATMCVHPCVISDYPDRPLMSIGIDYFKLGDIPVSRDYNTSQLFERHGRYYKI